MVFQELIDAGHRRVGEMVILLDVTASRVSLIRTMVLISVICVGVGAIIVVSLYVFLGWVQQKYARPSDILHENQETMRTLLDAPNDAALLLETNGSIIAANQTARLELGLDSRETSGLVIYDLLPKEISSALRKHIDQAASKARPVKYEHHANNKWCTNHIFPIKNAAGDIARIALYSHDITKAKLAEEKLHQALATSQTILNGMPFGVIVVGRDKHIRTINPAALEMIQAEEADIVGKICHHTICPSQKGKCPIMDLGQCVDSSERILLRTDGQKIPILKTVIPINLQGEDVLLEAFVDITANKQAEETLQKAKAQLEKANKSLQQATAKARQADKSKSEFLANMSHEIRTPMTAILGFTEQLKNPQLPWEQREEYLEIIARNGKHLLGLINDILDLSKIEADKLTVEQIPCRPTAVIADVVSLMRVKTTQAGVNLSVRYEGKIPETIQSDPTRLRQILVNLVGNAVKFTDKGDVQIVVNFLPAWRDETPAMRIRVIDEGIGMDEDVLAKIFIPFKQGDSSTSRRYGGTGLGLAISHKLAKLLGGELTANSTPGQGSEFTLTIPTGEINGVPMLSDQAEALNGKDRSDRPGLSQTTPLEGLGILLAEDGRDNQLLISMILRQAGATVEIVDNGREAVQLAEDTGAEKFDVILMDMQMPEMDGYEATRKLRDDGIETPIIALTANAMREDRQKCLEAGCADYCTKPIDRSRLIQTLAQYAIRATPGHDNQPCSQAPKPTDTSGLTVRSQFESDPCMMSILDEFVAQLPHNIREMRQASANGLFDELRRSAHQLKGAGGGYGYPQLTELGAELERAAERRDIEAITLLLNRLDTLCLAIQNGYKPIGVRKDKSS
jgi:PAS domain S-box-containing protein